MNNNEKLADLYRQQKELNALIKELDSKLKGHLRWWWLFPLFGFIVYIYLLEKKRQNSSISESITKVKVELFRVEIKIAQIEKQNNSTSN
ncbi:hypothetical protein ELUMI_v1c06150 [Williamsoniiplasma luminosum]|uniref:Uncharacterized protein n=1 Tax=Williamsoniiplasma luminosum TaxID=214888 RepID=A0A2K8NUA1_9MOLU|nr:hypothetical protein [Williamsoniiplasma luminosum]ATZ17337.1 hypothetical protein ELUMI_v1c06150 [Williamsoniiplasma luminosum]